MNAQCWQDRTSVLLAPLCIAAALLCCSCSSGEKSASSSARGAAVTSQTSQVTGNAVSQKAAGMEVWESFDQASQQLHKTLTALGYDTSEGDHAGPTSEAFLAVPKAGGAAIRVGANWHTDHPQGSFENLGNVDFGGVKMNLISRASARGVWFECKGLFLELLSTAGFEVIREVAPTIRIRMGC